MGIFISGSDDSLGLNLIIPETEFQKTAEDNQIKVSSLYVYAEKEKENEAIQNVESLIYEQMCSRKKFLLPIDFRYKRLYNLERLL